MNRQERAKQFMPFDALKGLKEALKAKEEKLTRVAKRELSEEQQEVLSEVITQLEKGMLVKATFYYKGHYVEITDRLQEKNIPLRYLGIGKSKLFFSDLYKVQILDKE